MAINKNSVGGKRTKKVNYPMGIGFKTPSNKQLGDMIRQGTDTTRTPIQFIDVARFDPILFYIQHRDRKELNFRLRYYYEFHPIVHNGISLHTELPLSDFVLQSSNSQFQYYYNDFKDTIGLLQLLKDILQDYFLLGEVFPHGYWNDYEKTWSHFILFPPENVSLRATYILPDPIMMLDVDEELKRIVTSGKGVDEQLTKMMDPVLVDQIAGGKQLLLKSWNTSHLSRKTARYDLRGTSILKSALKWLMLEDKLMLLKFTQIDRSVYPLKIFKVGNPATGWIPNRKHFEALRNLLISASNDPDFNIIYHHGLTVEFHTQHDKIANLKEDFELCENRILAALFSNKSLIHAEGPCLDPETEILTEKGFKKYWEVEDGEKIGTFNKDTEELEYQHFKNRIVRDFEGDLISFQTSKLDMVTTPNHRMWVQKRNWLNKFNDWEILPADKLERGTKKFRSVVKWRGEEPSDYIELGNYRICVEDYLRLVGYYVSEGFINRSQSDGKEPRGVSFSQSEFRKRSKWLSALTESWTYAAMEKVFNRLPFKVVSDSCSGRKKGWRVQDRDIAKHFYDNFGGGSKDKHLNNFVKNLPPKYLEILIEAMVLGDGSIEKTPKGYTHRSYFSISKKLSDDLYEIVFKAGYAPTQHRYSIEGGNAKYVVYFSDSPIGKFPNLEFKQGKNGGYERMPYKGKVWCFEVPNELLIVRRNGKIVVTGNTYSNASVAMRALMSRYSAIRDLLNRWMKVKVFTPLARSRGYYRSDTTGSSGQKQERVQGRYKILDLPTPHWKKLNLLDNTQQQTFMQNLRDKGQISHKTMMDIFDLDFVEETAQLEKEDNTIIDPNFIDTKAAFNKEPEVAEQILQGKKSKLLKLTSDEEKKSKSKGGKKKPAGGMGGGGGEDIGEFPDIGDEGDLPELGGGPAAGGILEEKPEMAGAEAPPSPEVTETKEAPGA